MIGRTVSLVSLVGGSRFKSGIWHTFASLVYFSVLRIGKSYHDIVHIEYDINTER